MPWTERVRERLADTFQGDEAALRRGVESGAMRLWQVGADSYAITEAFGDELLVHAYAGRNVRQFAAALCQAAHRSHFERVCFHTRRAALARMLRVLEPRHDGGGHYSVRVNYGRNNGQ